ncbi:unnamed protein product [Nippostrongylus brasiliensis]|uniref:Uncharacterized protein n=1 Tax=Nippostrongylus brasiliensis TaxID=27835 RepID=A0A0N4Y2R6_NIPBR|nr:unnamed protein product [Nippostrongylus brasiliensis]
MAENAQVRLLLGLLLDDNDDLDDGMMVVPFSDASFTNILGLHRKLQQQNQHHHHHHHHQQQQKQQKHQQQQQQQVETEKQHDRRQTG